MNLITVPVSFIAADQNGNPVAGARIKAVLDTTEIDDGFVAPEQVAAVVWD